MSWEVLTIAMTSGPELLNVLKSTFNYFKAIQIHKFHLTRMSTFIVSLNQDNENINSVRHTVHRLYYTK